MARKRKLNEEESSDSDYDEEELLDYPELQKCDKKIKAELSLVQEEIHKTEPNIVRILETPLLLADKVALYQHFEVYRNIPDDVSIEKLEARKEVQKLFRESIIRYKQYSRYTEEEHKNFETEIDQLERTNETEEMKYAILRLLTNDKNKRVIYSEYKRMLEMSVIDDERSKIQTWLKWAVSLPYNKMTTSQNESVSQILFNVRTRLNEELYGMNKVKEQILVFLNTKLTNPQMGKMSLGLLGPPGCGKTTIIRILADVLHFPLEHISLGGVHSPDFFKGHSYTYIGAQPGEIVKRLTKMGAKDGILFFDEYDKVENEEVSSALLHITDSSQNSKFHDNYLNGIDIDLSNLWMIFSMNKRTIGSAKDDRIFYITLDSYSQEDKFLIVKDYLLKKAIKFMNWTIGSVIFSDESIRFIVSQLSPENSSSIRPLEDSVFSIIRKINFLLCHQDKKGKLIFSSSFDIKRKVKFPFVVERNEIELFLD